MNSAELKNYLVQKLMHIDDEAFLLALKVIIDSSVHTSNDMESAPSASAEDGIDLSETIEEKTEREIQAWLKDID